MGKGESSDKSTEQGTGHRARRRRARNELILLLLMVLVMVMVMVQFGGLHVETKQSGCLTAHPFAFVSQKSQGKANHFQNEQYGIDDGSCFLSVKATLQGRHVGERGGLWRKEEGGRHWWGLPVPAHITMVRKRGGTTEKEREEQRQHPSIPPPPKKKRKKKKGTSFEPPSS